MPLIDVCHPHCAVAVKTSQSPAKCSDLSVPVGFERPPHPLLRGPQQLFELQTRTGFQVNEKYGRHILLAI